MSARKAVIGDARRIAEIQVRAWRVAYREVMSPDFLASLNVAKREAAWRSCVETGGILYVAEDNQSDIIGFLCLGEPRDEDLGDATELQAIYLDPDFYGSGIGTRFWNEVEKDIPTATVYLWVLSLNPIGIAFYEKNGFLADGTRKTIVIGGRKLEEMRFLKYLTD